MRAAAILYDVCVFRCTTIRESCGDPIRRMRASNTIIDYNSGAAGVGLISGR